MTNPTPLLWVLSLLLLLPTYSVEAESQRDTLQVLENNLSSTSEWELVNTQPLHFPSHHPQGLVKIGADFFLTAVETTQKPVIYDKPANGFDRSTGEGIGHLFKFSQNGELLADISLGEKSLYHPGGMDFDGESLWVSSAEYRPDSKSIVYKIDPASLEIQEVFRFSDHLGGILRDPQTDTLYGISWGSRKFYEWSSNDGSFNSHRVSMTENTSFYIDYQDCQWLPGHMLCSGLKNYRNENGSNLKLGGLDLIDLATLKPTVQLPVTITTESGTVLTQNPFSFDINERDELMLYFVPEDNTSILYTYRINQPLK